LERITIDTPDSRSEILVGAGWESVEGMLPEKGVAIITDDNIRQIYGSSFPAFPVFSVSPGEESKQLSVIEKLGRNLLEAGIDRDGFILGIGGGVVSDLAGFLAAIYLRGVRCGFVSSSLLSQVDASTGGKNGVNLGGTKNIIGVIRQPEFVVCDPGMLLTLPEEEYLSGLAEMIKTAIIGDRQLFGMIESNHRAVLNRDKELLTDLVAMCVRFKADVVTKDERETGLRRILNFGHTFGHAIEMRTQVRHGFAVASGMILATRFSYEKGLISPEEMERITGMIEKFGLLREYDIPADQIGELVMHDKKKSGSGIHFIFTSGIGKAYSERISLEEVIDFYRKDRTNRL
jgi:3-dehydroquinate synthase